MPRRTTESVSNLVADGTGDSSDGSRSLGEGLLSVLDGFLNLGVLGRVGGRGRVESDASEAGLSEGLEDGSHGGEDG